MTLVLCGTRIRNGSLSEGAGGCLVNFSDSPERVLLMTAGHAVVPATAKQNDEIVAMAAPDMPFGRLRTWSGLAGTTTVDVALIWVDPLMASADIVDLSKPPSGISIAPAVGNELRLYPNEGGGSARTTKIAELGCEVSMSVPSWQATSINYVGQIRCTPAVSRAGESGAIMLDSSNRIVGMLVGGAERIGDIVTPIDAILNYRGWNGVPNILTKIPAGAVGPGAAPAKQVTQPLAYGLPPVTGTKFSDLKDRYEALFARCEIRPERITDVAWYVKMLRDGRDRYQKVADTTGAPWWFVAIVHGMEGSFAFTTHLHNGDPLSARTVQVPAGRPTVWNPPNDWESSAIDAINYEGFGQQSDWTLARSLYRFERYNGYGYYARGINSPYLWSFSNLYSNGKFVSDNKYDPGFVSKQCGAAVMLKGLAAAGDVVL